MSLRWFGYLIPSQHTPVSRRIWTSVLAMAVYASGVVLAEHFLFGDQINIHPNFHALLGAVLGLFLGFRTNTAYDRWWEGRKLWGQLVNESRNLAILAQAVPRIERTEALSFGRLVINFSRALKEHLREGIRAKQLSLYKDAVFEPKHVPAHLTFQLREMVSLWAERKQIDPLRELMFDRHLAALMDICGGCERIRRTPLAYSYITYIRQGIALYLFTLPWGLVHELDYWTIPAVMIVSYFMIGIETIAEEVEEPFGRSLDDLMLDDICKTIDSTVTEILNTQTSWSERPGKAK
ncbi:MAG: hypothetical protein FJ271_20765 [Planctomycetes bacterium]|nr:hypothetical protein [Planctomycetota bacterium]